MTTTSPEPPAGSDDNPAPEPQEPPQGPPCALCGEEAVVNWLRRPTATELNMLVAAEEARRLEILLLADPQLPPPEFGPLPNGEGMTCTVYACGPHAISIDAAACIHQGTCTAPNPAYLPGCDCMPEFPEAAPMGFVHVSVKLPAHWVSNS